MPSGCVVPASETDLRPRPASVTHRTSAPRDDDAPLVDAQGRHITYLRLSLTDRCSFRCSYCSPSPDRPDPEALSADELVRLARLLVRRGVDRIRLTGGEPLLRDDVVEIAARVRALPGLRELCLTTNGHALERLGPALAPLIDRLNVSVDTAEPELFRQLTRTGDLGRVLRGLAVARQERDAGRGFGSIALNAVVMGGVNDSPPQLGALVRLAAQHGATLRFIELMPFSPQGEVVSSEEIRRRLALDGVVLTAADGPSPRPGSGPAIYWQSQVSGHPAGEVGFIGAMTENFCTRCNRLRLTATGGLRACLGGEDEVPLGHLLRSGADDSALVQAVRGALAAKRDGHRFVTLGGRGLFPMMGVGG